jgi:hypothetical protein
MPFIKIKGFKALVFIPDETKLKRKHNCKDCFACQMCSDERCEECLKSHCRRNGNDSTRDTECDINKADS